MPRLATPQALDRLVELIAQHPDGIGIEALSQAHGKQLQRRALQRRLAKLIAQGRIQTLGEARAVRYKTAPQDFDVSLHDGIELKDQAAAEILLKEPLVLEF